MNPRVAQDKKKADRFRKRMKQLEAKRDSNLCTNPVCERCRKRLAQSSKPVCLSCEKNVEQAQRRQAERLQAISEWIEEPLPESFSYRWRVD